MRGVPAHSSAAGTVAAARRAAIAALGAGCRGQSPTIEADVLMQHVTGLSRAQALARDSMHLAVEDAATFATLVQRRVRGEPIAYLVGTREFYGLDVRVTRDTLIPRPETELLVDVAREVAGASPTPAILDLGTGTGCLAVALATVFREARVWATDSSAGARAVALRNARAHGVADRVHVLAHDFGDPLPPDLHGAIDLVVSNPPYLSHAEWMAAPRDVREFEPKPALDGGPDGLRWYPALVARAAQALRASGWLLMEIGRTQAAAVRGLLGAEWTAVAVRQDLAGLNRAICARRR